MRTISVVLAFALCVSFVSVAAAQDKPVVKDEVMLRDGTTAMVTVVKTEPRAVTVKFTTKEGASGQTRLDASALDPHSFYQIRKKHMEKTVENHVKLAVWCAGAGLFNRAKGQMDAARALDPKVDEKIAELPDVMEGIADYLVEKAKRAYHAGDIQRAYEIAALIATRFPETAGGIQARAVLKELEKEALEQAEAKNDKREAAIEKEADAEKKKAARGRDRVLDGLEKQLSLGRRINHSALQEKNQSKAKRAYEAAAKEFTGLMANVEKAKAKAKDDATLLAKLEELEATARSEGVRAWINAGNVMLARGSRNDAMKCAQAAIALDPDDAAAKSFMNNVQMASAMSGFGRGR